MTAHDQLLDPPEAEEDHIELDEPQGDYERDHEPDGDWRSDETERTRDQIYDR